jgi:hypothetical protein
MAKSNRRAGGAASRNWVTDDWNDVETDFDPGRELNLSNGLSEDRNDEPWATWTNVNWVEKPTRKKVPKRFLGRKTEVC